MIGNLQTSLFELNAKNDRHKSQRASWRHSFWYAFIFVWFDLVAHSYNDWFELLEWHLTHNGSYIILKHEANFNPRPLNCYFEIFASIYWSGLEFTLVLPRNCVMWLLIVIKSILLCHYARILRSQPNIARVSDLTVGHAPRSTLSTRQISLLPWKPLQLQLFYPESPSFCDDHDII